MEKKRTFGLLREKVKQEFGTLLIFSDAMGMNKATLSKKVNGQTEWTRSEIEKACNLLGIPVAEVGDYFFYS